ncbi:MAG: YihY/virulence factor BrkB family protein [Candidatus Riflebacteria bacterium]|nr:YihY/virulence factor BrkB family protein [Candidatus Riflebacteria bacterium]
MNFLWQRIKYLAALGWGTWNRFSEVKGSEAAAAIAYYALFSLIPLLVLVIVPSSTLLGRPEIYAKIMSYTREFLPTSEYVIQATMDKLVLIKGDSFWTLGGLFGFGALLWSATGVFAGLAQNINQAWYQASPRTFLIERAIAVMMIAFLTVLLGVTIILTTVLQFYLGWLSKQQNPHILMPFEQKSTALLLVLIPLLFTFTFFFLMYRFIPNTQVYWREAAWGALFSTVFGEFTKTAFVLWYFFLGAEGLQNVYGGMSAVVGFMFWMYLSSMIILLGANLSATLAFTNRPPETLMQEQKAAQGPINIFVPIEKKK